MIDDEKGTVSPVRKSDWRNVPDAVFAASRIVGLRMRIPHVSMTVLETILSIFYLLTVFLLNFLNGTCEPSVFAQDLG